MKKLLLALSVTVAMGVMAQSYVGQFSHNGLERDYNRTLHYQPTADGYIKCHNGSHLYTRALYGGNTSFRLETSDRPIFGAFYGKDNRNIHFILDINGRKMRLDSTLNCDSYYRGGERRYVLTDPAWKNGRMEITALAPRDSESGIWKIESYGLPKNTKLTAVCCGTVKIKLSRNGDIGADPANYLAPDPEGRDRRQCTVEIGGKKTTAYISYNDRDITAGDQKKLALEFAEADRQRSELTGRLKIETPDPYFSTLGHVITHAADGAWDGKTWLHGAVGWRTPLSGWRGAYSGDFLGWHDRGRSHFDAYAKSQVTDVPPTIAHPSQDSSKNIARAAKKWGTQMYSNGYICRKPEVNDQMHHYDMNLCYMDELLWHLKWTGDLGYARKMWPVITSHLAWEKRNYDPDDDGLYDAYCCIWASDALYYNSGGVTHSSAYNHRANKIAAEIAEKIGEDPTPYKKEADKILKAINTTLWMPDKGVWAEHKDFMGHKRLHDHPAVWTVYHAIDSDVADPFQAYSATSYVENNIPHIPVTADGLEGDYSTISTTDWLPYAWSINNVAFAEVYHTALSFWQAGRNDEAARLLKSAMLDGMFMGVSPGNIGQVSHYDAARGECYRDFADPSGMMSRAVVQGLFGFNPDALNRKATVCPGFPSGWNHASIEHPDFTLSFKREGKRDTYHFSNSIDSVQSVDFILPVYHETVDKVTANGREVVWEVVKNSIGIPRVRASVDVPSGGNCEISVVCNGTPIKDLVVAETVSSRPGFDEFRSGNVSWWEEAKGFRHTMPDAAVLGLDLGNDPHDSYETIDLSSLYNANIPDIFRNRYESPRSPYTTLQIPVQGIGEWCHPEDTAHIDDSGMRARIGEDGVLRTSRGIPFAVPASGHNIAYTSLFDNYPDSVSVPLSGKADAIHLLLAGSTNHMQCHVDNAVVKVRYADGTESILPLRAPNNWCPIEQDYYIDGKAFSVDTPRPYRLIFSDCTVTDNAGETLGLKGVYGRRIDGGAGVMLRMPLDPQKELKTLTLETLSNDIVAGIIGATYVRK